MRFLSIYKCPDRNTPPTPEEMARRDFLARLGRHAEACAEFERAASLTQKERERALQAERARESGAKVDPDA